MTAYLRSVQSGAPAADLLCPAASVPSWPRFTGFAVGEPRPGRGELVYPVRLSLAAGGTATHWVTVALGPGRPAVCAVTTWRA